MNSEYTPSPRKKRKVRESLVYGVGVNDAPYKVVDKVGGKVIWECPYYNRWRSVLGRCYSKPALKKAKHYHGCSVCDEWLYFMAFRKWMEKQDWEGKQLDKDLLVRGNKVYSPETCIFVPPKINSFATAANTIRGYCPIGVRHVTNGYNRYAGVVSDGKGKDKQLGYSFVALDMHIEWQKYKLKLAREYREEYFEDTKIRSVMDRIIANLEYTSENRILIENITT